MNISNYIKKQNDIDLDGVIFYERLIEQCRGTNKLLGTDYGEIFKDSFILNAGQNKFLNEICVLMRSYIVIDDIVIDGNFSNSYPLSVIKPKISLEIIEREIQKRIHKLNCDATVWRYCRDRYRAGQECFRAREPFESVYEKCFLLDLPFRLNFKIRSKNINSVRVFIKNYLFALQLLDDWADFFEDIVAKHSNNLLHDKFPFESSDAQQKTFLNIVVRYILITIRRVMIAFKVPDLPQICAVYREGLLEWIEWILVADQITDEESDILTSEDNFSNFSNFCGFDWKRIKQITSTKLREPLSLQGHVCAENAHRKKGILLNRLPLSTMASQGALNA